MDGEVRHQHEEVLVAAGGVARAERCLVDQLFRQNEDINKQNPVGPTAGRKMPKAPVTGPQTTPAADSLTFIDLFSGCGGFSLGLEWAGLRCLAAIDSNESAIGTLKRNHPEWQVRVTSLSNF